jgi:hypothetical protein
MKKPAKAKGKSKGKAKGKAKAAKQKRVSSKAVEQVTPTYLAKGASVRMGLHDVIKAVKMIEKNGHLAKFTNRLRRAQAQVSVPADTVNLVKDFIVENEMHKTSMGEHIVKGRRRAAGGPTPPQPSASPADAATSRSRSFAADDGDPNRCHFGPAERG